MGKRAELTGQRFGRLVVESFAYAGAHGRSMWNCKCDCGKSAIVGTGQLKRGRKKSCGCLRRETAKMMMMKHGGTYTRLYSIWEAMKARTEYSSSQSYENYGGRGIKVCDEWRHDFQKFHDWAMAHGYQDDLTIDRIDVNGNYCPENCRWATKKEQGRNKRDIPKITYNGETLTLAEWSEKLDIKKTTLQTRIYNLGWSVKEAFETPVKGKR